MGASNSVDRNSWTLHGPCSARVIVWNYIHFMGHPPKTLHLDQCPEYALILKAHCCTDHTCHPNRVWDGDFEHYSWDDWDGMADPTLGTPLENLGVQWSWTCNAIFKGEVAGGGYLGPVPAKRDMMGWKRREMEGLRRKGEMVVVINETVVGNEVAVG